jgi:transcriptional regulator with XRE-family HTH domain
MAQLEDLRTKAGFTADRVAAALLIDPEIYEKLENGDLDPSVNVLRSLAALLRVPLDMLTGLGPAADLGFAANHSILNNDTTGYWGDIGIELPGRQIEWHPISEQTADSLDSDLCRAISGESVYFETLDNRAIRFFPDRALRVILQDEANDDLPNAAPKPLAKIEEEGGLPAVIYRGLTAHAQFDDEVMQTLGEVFMDMIESLIDDAQIDEGILAGNLTDVKFHMNDGSVIDLEPGSGTYLEIADGSIFDLTGTTIRLEDEAKGTQYISKSKICIIDMPLTLLCEARSFDAENDK